MDKVNKKVLIGSLILTVFFVGVLYVYLSRTNEPMQTANVAESAELTRIYVAARDIPSSRRISSDDIKEVRVASSLLTENAVRNRDELLGKYALQTIYRDEQFIDKRLAVSFEETVEFEVPEGKRAVTIPIDELSSVAYNANIGDRVDVIATFNKENLDNIPVFENSAQIIIQNAKVLSYGVRTQEEPNPQKETTSLITLLVTPQDAERLVYVDVYANSIRLILRGEDDDTDVETTGARRDYFKR